MNALQRGFLGALGASFFLLPACGGFEEEGGGANSAANPPPQASATTAEAPKESPPPPPLPQLQGTVIKVRGSTTVGQSLAPKLAMAYLTQAGASDAKLDDSGKAHERVLASGHVNGQQVTFVIETPGSGVAFKCLKDASCDIGMSSRPISAEEVASLNSLGDMTAPTNEHIVAMDGIAVVVNRSNRLVKLTMTQISGIFSGQITRWQQVDCSAPAARSIGSSGTRARARTETFAQFARCGGGTWRRTGAQVLEDNQAISGAVAKDENGIGFVGLPYVDQCKAVAVQDGDAAPLAPSTFSVATEDYAFSRRLYLYTPEHIAQQQAASFVEYALSDAAQKVVADTWGSCPLSVDAFDAAEPSPQRTGRLREGHRRRQAPFRSTSASGRVRRPWTEKPWPTSIGSAGTSRRTPRSQTSCCSALPTTQGRSPATSTSRASALTYWPTSSGSEAGSSPRRPRASVAPCPWPPTTPKKARKKNRRVEVWLQVDASAKLLDVQRVQALAGLNAPFAV